MQRKIPMNTFRHFPQDYTNSRARGFYSEVHCVPNSGHESRIPVCNCLSEKHLLDGLRKAVGQLHNPRRKYNTTNCTKSEYFYDILNAVTSLDCEFKKLEHLFNSFKIQNVVPSDNKTRLNYSIDNTGFLKLAAKSLLKFINNLKEELLTEVSIAEGHNRKTICHTNQLISSLEVNLYGLLKKLEDFKLQLMEKNTCSHLHSHNDAIRKISNRTNVVGITENDQSCSVVSPKDGSNGSCACYFCKTNIIEKDINLNQVTKSEVLQCNQSDVVNFVPREENERSAFVKDYNHCQHKKGCNKNAFSANLNNKCKCDKVECKKALYEVRKLEKIKYRNSPQTGNSNIVREHKINNNNIQCTTDNRIVTSVKQRGSSKNRRKIRYSLPITLTQEDDKHYNSYGRKRRRKRAGKDHMARRSRSKLNYSGERSRQYDRRKQHVNRPKTNVKKRHRKKTNSSYSSSSSSENNEYEMLQSISSESSSDQSNIRENKHLKRNREKNQRNSMEKINKKKTKPKSRYHSKYIKTKSSKYSVDSSKPYEKPKRNQNSKRERKGRSTIRQLQYKTSSDKMKPQFHRPWYHRYRSNINQNYRHKPLNSFEVSDSKNNKDNFIFTRPKTEYKKYKSYTKTGMSQEEILKVDQIKRYFLKERYSNLNASYPLIPNDLFSHYQNKNRNYEPCAGNYYQYFKCIPICEKAVPEVYEHNRPIVCSLPCECSHEVQSDPEIELIPICNPNKNKARTYNEELNVNLRTRSLSEEILKKPISSKHHKKLYKRKSIYMKSIESKTTNSVILNQTHTQSDSSTSSSPSKQSSSSYGEVVAFKKQLYYKNIPSHESRETMNKSRSKERRVYNHKIKKEISSTSEKDRVPSYGHVYYKKKSHSNRQKNKTFRYIGENELEYEIPWSEDEIPQSEDEIPRSADEILATTRTARRKHNKYGKLKKTINEQTFDDERLASSEEAPVKDNYRPVKYITYRHRKYRRTGNLNNARNENVIEEYDVPSTADEVHTASPLNSRHYKRSRKYHKASREQMFEDILTRPPDKIPAPPAPEPKRQTQVPPSKDTYSRGTGTDALPLHAKRTSTTELVQLMKTIGTNTQPILINNRPIDVFTKGTETDVTQSLPKRTSTTDLIGLIKTIGTNTQRTTTRDLGIDPIPQKPDTPSPIIDTRTAFTNTDKITVQNTGTDSIPEKPKPLMTSVATDPLFYLGQKNKDTNTLAEKAKDLKDIGTDPRPIQTVQKSTIATDPLYYLGQSVKHTNTSPIVTEDKGTETLLKQDLVSHGTDPLRIETKEKHTSYDGVKTVERANDPIKSTVVDKSQQYDTIENKPKVKSVYTGTDIYAMSGKITQTSFIEEPPKKLKIHDVDIQTTREKHAIWQKEPEQKPLPPDSPPTLKQPRKREIINIPKDSDTTLYTTPKTPEEMSEVSKEEDDSVTPSELSVHLMFEKCHEEIYRRRGDLFKPRCMENQRKFVVCEKKRSNTIRITNRSDCENTINIGKKQSLPTVELKLSLRTIRSPNSTQNIKTSTRSKQNKSSSPDRSEPTRLRENSDMFVYKKQPNKRPHTSRKDVNMTAYTRRKSSVQVIPTESSDATSRPTFRKHYWRDIADKVKGDK